jgi:hypothetical protein
MTIDTMDELVAAMTTGGERTHYYRVGVAQGTAGLWTSFWKTGGYPGAASASPPTGVGEVPTRSTAGALKFTNPASGKNKHLVVFNGSGTQRGTLMVFDRLVHTSGLSGTVTTAQTVNTVAITRPDALGADVECWAEVYTAVGTTQRTLTVNYTNQSNAAKTGTLLLGGATGFSQINRMVPLSMAAGDTGVRSVQSVQLSASTGTAGDFGITLLRRIAFLDIVNTGGGYGKDFAALGMPLINSDACLAVMGMFDSSTSATVYGEFVFAEEQ